MREAGDKRAEGFRLAQPVYELGTPSAGTKRKLKRFGELSVIDSVIAFSWVRHKNDETFVSPFNQSRLTWQYHRYVGASSIECHEEAIGSWKSVWERDEGTQLKFLTHVNCSTCCHIESIRFMFIYDSETLLLTESQIWFRNYIRAEKKSCYLCCH